MDFPLLHAMFLLEGVRARGFNAWLSGRLVGIPFDLDLKCRDPGILCEKPIPAELVLLELGKIGVSL